MKKNYITPSCKEFQVRPLGLILAGSIKIDGDGNDGWGNTKAEKEQNSGIWDLYEK